MTLLLRFAPYLIVGLLIAGGVYWVSEGRYSAGYLAGDTAGFKRGAESTHKLRDEETARLMAQRAADSEKTLREANDTNRKEKDRHEAEKESLRERADADLAGIVVERDRAIRMYYDANRLRAADSRRRLPATIAAEPAEAISTVVFPERSIERVFNWAAEADALNLRYGMCLRLYESWRSGAVAQGAPQ